MLTSTQPHSSSTQTTGDGQAAGLAGVGGSLFYDIEMRDTKLKILNRYSDVTMIGAGAQGLVLYVSNIHPSLMLEYAL